MIGSATGGYFIDKIGFRAVQLVATLMGGLLFMLIGQVTHFTLLCLLTVALSFVAEAFRPANSSCNRESIVHTARLRRFAARITRRVSGARRTIR